MLQRGVGAPRGAVGPAAAPVLQQLGILCAPLVWMVLVVWFHNKVVQCAGSTLPVVKA